MNKVINQASKIANTEAESKIVEVVKNQIDVNFSSGFKNITLNTLKNIGIYLISIVLFVFITLTVIYFINNRRKRNGKRLIRGNNMIVNMIVISFISAITIISINNTINYNNSEKLSKSDTISIIDSETDSFIGVNVDGKDGFYMVKDDKDSHELLISDFTNEMVASEDDKKLIKMLINNSDMSGFYYNKSDLDAGIELDFNIDIDGQKMSKRFILASIDSEFSSKVVVDKKKDGNKKIKDELEYLRSVTRKAEQQVEANKKGE